LILQAIIERHPSCSAFSVSKSSSSAADLDLQVIERQLGYLPPNVLAVSARTATGSPIAIQTYPLLKKQKKELKQNSYDNDISPLDRLGTPFPTHYWLTDPDISRAIAEVCKRDKRCKLIDLPEHCNFAVPKDEIP
jgi:hypothetical protein